MDYQFNFDFVSHSKMSYDLLNEAFRESLNGESDESLRSLSKGSNSGGKYSKTSKCFDHGKNLRKDSTGVYQQQKYRKSKETASEDSTEILEEVFEPISTKNSLLHHFGCQNPETLENSRCSPTVRKFSLSRHSSEIDNLFSPLGDISNVTPRRSSSKDFGFANNSNVFASTSKLGDLRFPRNRKGDCHAMPKLTKTKGTKVEDLIFQENGNTKQPIEVLKCYTSTKKGVHYRKQIPALNRKTQNQLPLLKSEESNLRNELQSPTTANEKFSNTAISALKCFTPDSSDECLKKRNSLQHENQLRENRLLAEKKHRKSISSILRKNSTFKPESNVPGNQISDGLILPDFQSSSPDCTLTLPVKENFINKCADMMSVPQNEKIDSLVEESGILEVTNLTLYSNTAYFSRTFGHTFESPKKPEDKVEISSKRIF